MRMMGFEGKAHRDIHSEEEIKLLLTESEEGGAIAESSNELIQNVFEFDDLTIDEICVHRTDVDLLWLEDSMEEWEQLMRRRC